MTTADDLQKAHAALFVTLIEASKLWFQLVDKYAAYPDTDPDKIVFKQWTANIAQIIGTWFADQQEYEEKGISKHIDFKPSDFFDRNKISSLNVFKAAYAGDIQAGVGEWAWLIGTVIALFSAAYIANRFTTSTSERQSLLQSTADMAKKLNLSPAQTAALLSQVNTSTTSDIGGTIKNVILGVAVIFGLNMLSKNKK